MRAATDDMQGRFSKTSEAYVAGRADGRRDGIRSALAVLEKMIWDREGDRRAVHETDLLKAIMGDIRSLSA